MSVIDISLSPHYRAAEKRRQRMLDFLLAHPGAHLRDIGAHMMDLDDTYAQAANLIVTMIEWGEIKCTGQQRGRQFFAAVATTRSDAECCAQRNARLAHANELRRQEKLAQDTARTIPGHDVHTPGKRPLRNQGGQGACRAPVYASGAQNY